MSRTRLYHPPRPPRPIRREGDDLAGSQHGEQVAQCSCASLVVSAGFAGRPIDRAYIPAPHDAGDHPAIAVPADQGRYADSIRLMLDLMARTTLDAPAHFLLGIIHQAAGERAKAEAELTKAIYLDPEHDEALLALAFLARRKGDVAAEATFRRRADRVLARKER